MTDTSATIFTTRSFKVATSFLDFVTEITQNELFVYIIECGSKFVVRTNNKNHPLMLTVALSAAAFQAGFYSGKEQLRTIENLN